MSCLCTELYDKPISVAYSNDLRQLYVNTKQKCSVRHNL